MAITIVADDEPGPGDEKPHSMWRSEDGQRLVCPFFGREESSDDRLGFHFVRNHWREIRYATKQVRDMNR